MKLKLEDFKQWVSNNPDKFVGRKGHACDCPIANYLKSVGYKSPTVNGNYIVESFTNNKIQTPKWASNFINLIDNYGNDEPADMNPILKTTALKLLENIEL